MKHFSIIITMFLASLSFLSCSSDEDNSNTSPIIGTWCGYQGHKSSGILVESYTFNKDNSCEHYWGSSTKIGTYSTSRNTLTMNFYKVRNSKGEETNQSYNWVYTYSISGNELKLSDEEGYDIYYRK